MTAAHKTANKEGRVALKEPLKMKKQEIAARKTQGDKFGREQEVATDRVAKKVAVAENTHRLADLENQLEEMRQDSPTRNT